MIEIKIQCACGCPRFVRVVLGSTGYQVSFRDAGHWILTTEQTDPERVDLHAMARACRDRIAGDKRDRSRRATTQSDRGRR